jgi:hypothetical protein
MQRVSCLNLFYHILVRVSCPSFNPHLACSNFHLCVSLKEKWKGKLIFHLLEVNRGNCLGLFAGHVEEMEGAH